MGKSKTKPREIPTSPELVPEAGSVIKHQEWIEAAWSPGADLSGTRCGPSPLSVTGVN